MSSEASAPSARGSGLSGVEVLVRWGERTLERAFVDGEARRAFRLGEQGCDFYAHRRWLGAASVELVSVAHGEAALGSHARAALQPGEVAAWAFGPLCVEARWAVAPPLVPVPLADRLDYLALNALIGAAAVMCLGIGAAVAYGVEEGSDDPGPGTGVAKLVKFVTTPAPKERRAQREPDAAAKSGSARAPRPEGASGEVLPHRKPGRALAGQRSDRDQARAALSQLFSGKTMSGLVGGKGLGDSLRAAVGGIETAAACVGASCAGLGLKGDGSGGGGLDRDLGAFGLRTQGRAGGDKGYGRGPRLGKSYGVGGLPACLVDEKTGQCDEGPSTIERSETVICGAKPGDGLGCLDKELIRKVIRANLGGVRACYERALTATRSLDGKVSVRFTIALDGTVPQAAVAQSTANHPFLEACVVGRMRALKFPRSRGVAVVTYPFIFKTSGN